MLKKGSKREINVVVCIRFEIFLGGGFHKVHSR